MPSSTPPWAESAAQVPSPPMQQNNADQHPGQLNGTSPQGNDYSTPATPEIAPMALGAGEAGGVEGLAALAL